MSDDRRYFIGRDCSSHWYIVPAEKRAAWEAWANISEDDERSWDVPDYARRIDNPYRMTFRDPVEL